jgi:DNA adenine methylase
MSFAIEPSVLTRESVQIEPPAPNPKSFLKWVGGKKQLIPEILKSFPEAIDTYHEPFVGGGALFWHLAGKKAFKEASINDWNSELVICYRVIRDDPHKLMAALDKLYYDKILFLTQRALDPKKLDDIARAARMIFLNKWGFNGLYRVNKSGQFNVPFGAYKTPPTLYNSLNILDCHAVLQDVWIHNGDFEACLETAKRGDLVYFDPPYVPLNPTSDFTSYTSAGFGLAEQTRLANLVHELANREVRVVLSNSDTPLVRELYKDFEIREIMARRSINSKGDGRGAVKELLVLTCGQNVLLAQSLSGL